MHTRLLVLIVAVGVGASCTTTINLGCLGTVICHNHPPDKPEVEGRGKGSETVAEKLAFVGLARRPDGSQFQIRGRLALEPLAPPPPLPTGVIEPGSYLGCFRVDENGAANTALSYGGVAGRLLPDGTVKLYLTANCTGADPWVESILEVTDPGQYHVDYRQAPIAPTTLYENTYRPHKGTWRLGAPGVYDNFPNSPAAIGSFLWHEEHQGFYLTYTDGYDVTSSQSHGLLFLQLTADGKTIGYGPWSLTATDGEGRTMTGPRCAGYVARHPNGNMICGGTLISGNANCCWGPGYLTGTPFPTKDTPVGETLRITMPERGPWGYFMGPHAILGRQLNQGGKLADENVLKRLHEQYKRDPKSVGKKVRAFFRAFAREEDIPGLTSDTYPLRSFRRRVDAPPHEQFDGNEFAQADPTLRVDIQKYADAIGPTCSWSDLDFIGGLVYVEVNGRAGYLYFANQIGPSEDGDGHNWYANNYKPTCPLHGVPPATTGITGPVTDSAFPSMIVYDPATIQAVIDGTLKDWQAEAAYQLNLEAQYPGFRSAPITTVGGAKTINAGVFIRETRTLYAVTHRADDTRWQGTGALIHAWRWAA